MDARVCVCVEVGVSGGGVIDYRSPGMAVVAAAAKRTGGQEKQGFRA